MLREQSISTAGPEFHIDSIHLNFFRIGLDPMTAITNYRTHRHCWYRFCSFPIEYRDYPISISRSLSGFFPSSEPFFATIDTQRWTILLAEEESVLGEKARVSC